MRRAFCEKCKGYSFVVDNRLLCCGRDVDAEFDVQNIRGVTCGPIPRIRLSDSRQLDILQSQGGRCIYCFKEISHDMGNLHFDHFIPYSYCGSNEEDNFVASCAECNLRKGSKIFDSIADARVFINERRDVSSGKNAIQMFFKHIPNNLFNHIVIGDKNNATVTLFSGIEIEIIAKMIND